MTPDIEDEQIFKTYVIKKLEAISDADSEVLADYVVALVKTDDAEAVSTALEDFIPDSAQTFVNEIFSAIAHKSYNPNATRSKGTTDGVESTARANHKPIKLPATSRKRTYHDWDAEKGHNGHVKVLETTARPPKRTQRGGRPSSTSRSEIPPHPHNSPSNQPRHSMQFPPPPTPPHGMPPFDLSNPMASIMAMHQTMGMLLGMSSGDVFEPTGAVSGTPEERRCRDYDTQGFCTRGTSCPYEHGENPVLVPNQNDEYDPKEPFMLDTEPLRRNNSHAVGTSSIATRQNKNNHRRGNSQRAPFSMAGSNRANRSITSIVVEQIPQDYLNELAVRSFFSQFGQIDDITFHYHRALAIVKYTAHKSARAAYQSPKCIFENRFVKVFWHDPEKMDFEANGQASAAHIVDMSMASESPPIDLEEVARLQDEAQTRHDAAKKRRIEVLEQRRDLDQKLSKINLERQRTIELLAKKSTGSVSGDEDAQTTALKARLAELQSEAKNLGIDMDGESVHNGHAPPPTYARGGSTGSSRGRGHTASYRGRGGGRSVMTLDNRPKTVALTFADSRYQDHEEALRQYLMFNGLDSASLTQHPTRDDTALIRFQQRYEGENFLAAASYDGPLAHSDLPKVIGKVKLDWYKPSQISDDSHNDESDGAVPRLNVDADGGAQNGLHADRTVDPSPREIRDMDTYDEAEEVY